MTEKLKSKFHEYATYHTKKENQKTHYVGIPLIATSLLGLLSMIKIGPFDGGLLFALMGVIYYFNLDKKLTGLFLFALIPMYLIGTQLNLTTIVLMQIVGWIAQMIGHYVYEKKSPAFYKNIEHTLIGPFWIFSKLIGYK